LWILKNLLGLDFPETEEYKVSILSISETPEKLTIEVALRRRIKEEGLGLSKLLEKNFWSIPLIYNKHTGTVGASISIETPLFIPTGVLKAVVKLLECLEKKAEEWKEKTATKEEEEVKPKPRQYKEVIERREWKIKHVSTTGASMMSGEKVKSNGEST